MTANLHRHPSSYRDPAGFVFEQNGTIYRQVNKCYQPHYEKLVSSGLYQRLTHEKLLISHEEVESMSAEGAYKIIRPTKLNWISQPYEWCYDMLREAALLTLKIQSISLAHGMILKDAHPFNIQFVGAHPLLIDSLSFECWNEDEPWVAYRQFCETFLLPLIIGSYAGPESPKLLNAWPNGVPLKVGIKMLPFKAKYNLHWLLNIFLNAKKDLDKPQTPNNSLSFSKEKMNRLVESLMIATKNCQVKNPVSSWTSYEKEVTTRGEYTPHKEQILSDWASTLSQKITILDLGANSGSYTFLLNEIAGDCLLLEPDAATCNLLFKKLRTSNLVNGTPLCISFESLMARSISHPFVNTLTAQAVLCLGLLHHLLYRSNIPLERVIETLSNLTRQYLVIEYIGPDDPILAEHFNMDLLKELKVSKEEFEVHLQSQFNILQTSNIKDSTRTLYICSKR